MNWDEFVNTTGLHDVTVIIKKPVRNGNEFTRGKLSGFKSGLLGGGWRTKKRDKEVVRASFESSRIHWIKKPKVLVVYNTFIYHGGQLSDWIDVDNCEFEINH